MLAAPLSTTESRVNRAAVSIAVDSLLKWIEAQRNIKNKAGNSNASIYLILTLTKTPHRLQSKPYSISLPHLLHDSSSISLILDDSPNSLPNITTARELLCSHSIPISQILSTSDLCSEFFPDSELTFVDCRIGRLIRNLETKSRNKKSNKRSKPVEVDFTRNDWPDYMRRMCFSTVFNLGSGTCSGIRVGRALQRRSGIVDNVLAGVNGAIQNVPLKWSNVMGFYLKTSESLALPIYVKSDWNQKKVGDHAAAAATDEDVNSEEEEDEDEEVGYEKLREKMAERMPIKRTMTGSKLNSGRVSKIMKKSLRHNTAT